VKERSLREEKEQNLVVQQEQEMQRRELSEQVLAQVEKERKLQAREDKYKQLRDQRQSLIRKLEHKVQELRGLVVGREGQVKELNERKEIIGKEVEQLKDEVVELREGLFKEREKHDICVSACEKEIQTYSRQIASIKEKLHANAVMKDRASRDIAQLKSKREKAIAKFKVVTGLILIYFS
jgi:ribosomal protein L29